jgi:hypothetical protein
MSAPTLVFSEGVDLPDGRTVRVLAYDDGSLRFKVRGGLPYAITEAFITGTDSRADGRPRQAILMLRPAPGSEPEPETS